MYDPIIGLLNVIISSCDVIVIFLILQNIMIFNTSAIVIIIVVVIAIIAVLIVFKYLYLRRKSFGGFRVGKLGPSDFIYDAYSSDTPYESRIEQMISTYGYVNIAAVMGYGHANLSYDVYKPVVYVDPTKSAHAFKKNAHGYKDDLIGVADGVMPFLERVDQMKSIKNKVKYFHIDYGMCGSNYVTARGFEIIKTLLSKDGYIICSAELLSLYFNNKNRLYVYGTPDNSPDTIYKNYDVIIPDNQAPPFVSEDASVFPDYTSFVRDGIHYENSKNKYYYTLSAIINTLEYHKEFVDDKRRQFILNVNGLTEEAYERIINDRKNITRDELYLLLSISGKEFERKEDVSRYIFRNLTPDEEQLFNIWYTGYVRMDDVNTSSLSKTELECEFNGYKYIEVMIKEEKTFRWANVFASFMQLFCYLVHGVKTFRRDPHDQSYALLCTRATTAGLNFDEFYDVLVGWGGSLERTFSPSSVIKFFALKPIV